MKKTSAHGLEILLALVMMARGTSFIFSKLLLETMSTFQRFDATFWDCFPDIGSDICPTPLSCQPESMGSGILDWLPIFLGDVTGAYCFDHGRYRSGSTD